jgi:hypothetical protein
VREKMKVIKQKSLRAEREERSLPNAIEQEITDMELDNIERDMAITDNELAILEIQQQLSD